jgi:polysaccharide biosynthesis transport protein
MVQNTQNIVKYGHFEYPLDLPPQGRDHYLKTQALTAPDLWTIFKKRKLTIIGFAASVCALVVAYTYTRKPVYEAVARLQIDPSRPTNLGIDENEKAPGQPSSIDNYLKTEVMIIQSQTVATRVMNALKLYANPVFAGRMASLPVSDMSQLTLHDRQQLLTVFDKDLNVSRTPDTEIVEVRFRSPDAALAAKAANAVVDEYMRRNFLVRVDGTAEVSLWLSKQLSEIKSSTADAQRKLADFQRENNFLGADESDNIVTNRLKRLNDELTEAEEDRIIKEGKYKLAEAGNPELVDSTSTDTTLQILQKRQTDLQAQYSELSAKFGNGYPRLHELQEELKQVNAQITAEDANVKSRLSNEFHAALDTEQMIRSKFVEQKEEANRLNEHASQYAILKHQVEAGQQLYDTLQLKLKTTGIISGLAASFVDVIDRAEVPDLPVGTPKGLNLVLGLGGGLLGGLLLGFVRDSFDDTIRTSEELEAVATLPELTCVPFVNALAKTESSRARSSLGGLQLRSNFTPIVLEDPSSPSVESYRSLCSHVLLSSIRNSTKVLVVTSATPREGKSTVSCNLATVLAQCARKVLLVDADLRCSSIPSPQGSGAGLGDIGLEGDSAAYPQPQPVADLPFLHVMPAGGRRPDPTGVLQSARMQELIAQWRAQYDHIIIDTPPALPFADALVLSTQADGVILVARSGMTRLRALLRVKSVLVRSGANVLGIVLNAARQREYYYKYPASYQPAVVCSKSCS